MRALTGLLLICCIAAGAGAAEAPLPMPDVPDSRPAPLPAAAEAAYQDLAADEVREIWLDEAVFTEISPLTIPEIGITLPADQEH